MIWNPWGVKSLSTATLSAPVSPPLCTSLLRARWARARDLVSGFVVMAKARLAQRPVARAVRADTLLSTVQSIQRSHVPTRDQRLTLDRDSRDKGGC